MGFNLPLLVDSCGKTTDGVKPLRYHDLKFWWEFKVKIPKVGASAGVAGTSYQETENSASKCKRTEDSFRPSSRARRLNNMDAITGDLRIQLACAMVCH